ncbi:hypothetical protein [Glaciibacter superstes]|uniref:hypothetical protein n=1 Tax=Glaciibacter superstes TaxID=501023 RepID=UPI0003B708DA|nr:hypothetical protein [Glaciibacter superstes]
MTNGTGPGGSGYQSAPDQGAPYQNHVQPYASAQPTRPPLTPKQRTGAMIAGGVGFVLVQIGLGLISLLLVVGFIAVVLGAIVAMTSNSGGVSRGFTEFADWLGSIDAVTVTVVVVVVAIVAILALVFGILASRWILKAHRVNRPTAVTWSAVGISVVANWIVGGLGFGFSGPMAGAFGNDVGYWVGGLLAIFGIIVSVAVGVFTWWWMAHVYRAPAAQAPAA